MSRTIRVRVNTIRVRVNTIRVDNRKLLFIGIFCEFLFQGKHNVPSLANRQYAPVSQ